MSSRNWGFDFYLTPRILEYARWLEYSDEHSNFTYSLKNLHHLIGWIAVVSRRGIGDAEKVVDEILADEWLVDYLADLESNLGFLHAAWRTRELRAMLFGRRIGWYALIRLKRPNFIVETGVDRGLGSAIICRAIMRNAEDGHTGSYLGTDINRDAGVLFSEPLNNLGRIAYGDSVETLRTLSKPIGMFINDSDHSAEYEASEYQVISEKLASDAIVLGDNSHVTTKLFEFARERNLNFLHFAEQPDGHWYPGAGIGAAF